jgi:hypothetical protein
LKILRILFFLAWGTHLSSLADSRGVSCAVSLLRQQSKILNEQMLTPAETEWITRMGTAKGWHLPDTHRMIFEVIVQARIRLLPPALQDDAQKLIKKYTSAFEVDPNNVSASSKSLLFNFREVKVSMPQELLLSPLKYSIFLHEIEHEFQDLMNPGKFRRIRDGYQNFIEEFYEAEDGAMRMEWVYLSRFPEWSRMQYAEMTRNLAGLSEAGRTLAVHQFENASFIQGAYLYRTRMAGRYSKNKIREMGPLRFAEQILSVARDVGFVCSGIVSIVYLLSRLAGP